MKKESLNVVVIFFITIAFMLVIYDITSPENQTYNNTADIDNITTSNDDIVSTDLGLED
ncbi:hypothetical protein AB9K26_12975 [Psychroserpens sp. XS_ASV72]|uniref:hypothetical protein n=1 Tax=Psychroserpens sp. XS_ASV72 TaxID=3241293 RepID=UPI0035181BBD